MKNKAVKGEEEERKMSEEGRCVFSCCIVGGFTQTVVLSLALQLLLATVYLSSVFFSTGKGKL